MKRNLENTLKKYNKAFGCSNQKGAFYIDDISQIVDIAKRNSDSYDIDSFLLEAISTSLKIGFQMGYDCKARESCTK